MKRETLASAPASRPRQKKRQRRWLVMVLAVLALAVPAATYWAWPTTVERREMHTSYAFNVNDLRILSGQADNIVFARVVGVADVDEELGTTSFTVEITDVIKGDLRGRQVVQQLGFSETNGKTHTTVEDPDQPLLRPGSEVLLTLGREPDGRNIIIGGPRSVVVLGAGTDRAALRMERVAAARNAQPVRDATGRVVMPVKQRPVHG